ncbi:glutamate--tRNA ligase [bacterium]|nr:glutamate--tRNA ligase [bacterium]
MSNQVRVRLAPSPTGYLHLGTLRVALYNYAFAKKNNGSFILRIEDTDQNRLVDDAVENIISTLNTIGVDFDEGPNKGGDYGPYVQSERLDIYKKYINELIGKGFAYHCFCDKETLDEMRTAQIERKEDPKYDRRCLKLSKEEVELRISRGDSYVIRLKMPDDRIFSFDDAIRGIVEINSNQIDDQVILKSDGFPTYHLAACVDDHLMEITHVFRGEEWISSTPKHLWLYECFGVQAPKFVHLPLIMNTDHSKLSKRKNDVSVENYLQKGYPVPAIINYIALIGWHTSDDREFFSLTDLCHEFSLDRVNKANGVFDIVKLNWMAGMYIREMSNEDLADKCRPFFENAGFDVSDQRKFLAVMDNAKDRIFCYSQAIEHSQMFYKDLSFSEEDQEVLADADSQNVLKYFIDNADNIPWDDNEELAQFIKAGSKELGIKGKKYFFPLRISLFGSSHGPDIPKLFAILGKNETIQRMEKVLH